LKEKEALGKRRGRRTIGPIKSEGGEKKKLKIRTRRRKMISGGVGSKRRYRRARED